MKRFVFVCALLLLAACRGERDVVAEELPVAVALSPDSAQHAFPIYSPDGARIAYWSRAADSTSDWLLTVANADLSAPTTLSVRNTDANGIIWHPDGIRLATVSSQYGAADVVIVSSATGEVTRATRDPGLEFPVSWSAEGSRLVFFRTSPDGMLRVDELSLADLTSRPLLPGESRPALAARSPDGAHIAYTLIDGSSTTIWVADSSGANARQLSTEGLEEFATLPWSPDSKQVLYQSRRTGTADLWIAHIDSAAPRQLTKNVRNDLNGAWSPDGQWIAFFSDRGKQTDVWVIPSAGGNERRVTNSTAEEQAPLAWRTGTRELSFSIASETSALWAVDLETGEERQLTPDSLRVEDFWLSPDGSQASVIFTYGGGARDLSVIPISGGAVRTLVSDEANIWSALHSPDGQQIAYVSDRSGSPDLWVVDVAGGVPRQLVNWPGLENSFAWSDDGAELYFSSDRESRLGDIWKIPRAGGEPTRVTRDGGMLNIIGRSGYRGVYVSRLNTAGGQLGLVALRPDGSVQTVWERSNVRNVYPLTSDSLIAMVEQPDGTLRGMVLSASGGGGRVFLNANERAGWPTADGRALVYSIPVRGATDIVVINMQDGSVRRVTTTPEDELGAELTPDQKSVVFVRRQLVQRIHSADLSRLLNREP